jgi:DNA adenine methylase
VLDKNAKVINLSSWEREMKRRESELDRLTRSWKRYQENLKYITGKVRPLFPYYGGKSYIADEIISLMPEHAVYLEPFGGSGTVLFYKKPAKIEVYNDINKRIVNIFKVLQDEELFMKFIRELVFTPYSRAIYDEYKRYVFEDDCENYTMPDLKRAVRDFYVLVCSVNGVGLRGNMSGMSRVVAGKASSSVRKYYSRLSLLEYFHERITGVHIECTNALDLIERYNNPDTFMYLDPPYHPSCVADRKQCYEYGFSIEDHRRMIEIVLDAKAKVMISGYENVDYDVLEEKGWYKVVLEVAERAVGAPNFDDTIVIDGKRTPIRQRRRECLWMNYWHDNLERYGYSKIGNDALFQ